MHEDNAMLTRWDVSNNSELVNQAAKDVPVPFFDGVVSARSFFAEDNTQAAIFGVGNL